MMRFGHAIEVVVHRYGADAFGDEVIRCSFTLSGCALSAVSTKETPGDTRQDVVTRLRLLAPAEADLRAGDEIVLRTGDRYRLTGQPAAPRSPFSGWCPGVIAEMERRTG